MTKTGILLLALLVALIALAALYGIWRGLLQAGPKRRYYAQPDFSDWAGFSVTGLPTDEIVSLTGSWLLAGGVAELLFRVQPGWELLLRVAQEGRSLRLDEFDGQYESFQAVNYDGVRVMLSQTPGGAGLATWKRDGFTYALFLPKGEMGLLAGTAIGFVRQTVTEAS